MALTVLFVVAGAAGLFGAITLANRLVVIGDLESGDFGADILDRVDEADDLVVASAFTFGGMVLATAAVFIVWMWRSSKNNEALGRDMPRLSSGWAIGGWFIPLANFVIPILIMQDLWRGSNASIPRGDMRWRIANRSALVGWWWGTLILSVLRFGPVGDTDPGTDLDDLRAADFAGLFAMLFAVASSVLAILVVRRLEARQVATLRAEQAAWTAVHATADRVGSGA